MERLRNGSDAKQDKQDKQKIKTIETRKENQMVIKKNKKDN